MLTIVAMLSGMAFLSGVLLAGLLGWWLLRTLRVAGVATVSPSIVPSDTIPPR